jgi:acetolactate synthase small subunit
MENCTLYSHKLEFEKIVQLLKKHVPKAHIDVQDQEENKSITATLKGGFFSKAKSLKLNYRQRKNPSYTLDKVECGLTQNLEGMVNYIQAFPAKNEAIKNKFLHKVKAANCEIAFIATPEITQEFETFLRELALELDAYIFAQPNKLFAKSQWQYFADKHLNLIIDNTGACEIQELEVNVDAKYYDQPAESYTKEQIERKEKSESFLEQHGIKTNKNLPCTIDAVAVEERTEKELIDRAYALLVIAAKGEGVEQEHLIKIVEAKRIDSFSPYETFIYDAATLSDQERAYATWRYESLYVVLWALGITEELKYPDEICDVSAIVSAIFQPSRENFEKMVKLKSPFEILDELDKTYRMNWACVDARISGNEVAGGINSSVVYERHYALNWLTNHQNQDWDAVQTNT